MVDSQHARTIYPKKPLLQRLQYFLRIHILKTLTSTYSQVVNFPVIRDNSILPTFTKVYPSRPTLTNRVFIPKSYKPDDAPLPLFIEIHGGGFALMAPSSDDKFCSGFANKNKVIVVSVDYPKSPAHPYPASVQSTTDIVKAILDDQTLPFDRKKVAIGGFSAGANLALAVSQDEAILKRIGGVTAFYPPVDWTSTIEEKIATRPEGAPPDVLEKHAPAFDWAYLRPGTNLEDPQLSVTFAARDKLPQKLYIVGCELDCLCRDSEVMAERWANIGTGSRVGTELVWQQNGVKWEKVLGEEHAFDTIPAFGEKKIRITQRGQKMYDDAAEFLFREVYNEH